MFLNLILVIIGGGLGSACRYLFSIFAARFGNNFPLGTLGVNLGGCFLIGFLFSLTGRNIISPTTRLLLMTGFLGGLTTFSTYALESVNFFRETEFSAALANIALNNLGGLALVFLGFWLGKSF